MTDDLGSYTLPNLAFSFRIDRQDKVGMGLDVDKTRRDGEAVCIDDLVRVPSQGRTERCNAAREESDIADGAPAAASVDEGAVADQDIPCHGGLRIASLPAASVA